MSFFVGRGSGLSTSAEDVAEILSMSPDKVRLLGRRRDMGMLGWKWGSYPQLKALSMGKLWENHSQPMDFTGFLRSFSPSIIFCFFFQYFLGQLVAIWPQVDPCWLLFSWGSWMHLWSAQISPVEGYRTSSRGGCFFFNKGGGGLLQGEGGDFFKGGGFFFNKGGGDFFKGGRGFFFKKGGSFW